MGSPGRWLFCCFGLGKAQAAGGNFVTAGSHLTKKGQGSLCYCSDSCDFSRFVHEVESSALSNVPRLILTVPVGGTDMGTGDGHS